MRTTQRPAARIDRPARSVGADGARVLTSIGVVLVLTLLLLLAGCSAVVDVRYDEDDAIGRYRYWSWLPSATEHINAEHRDTLFLELRMAELVREALEARGYRQSAKRAEFFVDYALVLSKRFETVEEASATQYLASFHSSHSFIVEGTRPRQLAHEDVHMVVRLWAPDGRMLWQGGLAHSQELADLPDLEDHVSKLVRRLPRPTEQRAPRAEEPNHSSLARADR